MQSIVVSVSAGDIPRARLAGIRLVAAARVVVTLAVMLGAVGVVVVDALPVDRDAASTVSAADHYAPEPPAAAALRYPLGCMGAALSTAGRQPNGGPRAVSACWRYGVYVTAILRQVRGVWRLALEAVSQSCPVVSLPAFVRAQLAVCRRATAHPAVPSG